LFSIILLLIGISLIHSKKSIAKAFLLNASKRILKIIFDKWDNSMLTFHFGYLF
jgi:hypothetical protein